MTAPQFDYSNIPPELQARRQWVLWGVDPDNPKAPRQVVSPTQGAKANNPMTWGSFEPARCIVDMIGDARGIGYEITPADGLVAVDFDHCLDADGNLLPPFDEWIKALPGYWELSQSGTGLHGFVRGTLPAGCSNKRRIDPQNADEREVELYIQERYIALTGALWGPQTTLADAPSAQPGINAILEQMHMRPEDTVAGAALPEIDNRPAAEVDAIIKAALAKSPDFYRLWNTTEHPGKLGDESKDDIAFVCSAWKATEYELSAGDLMHGLDASPWAETKDNTAPKWHWDKWHGTGHRSKGNYRKNTALRAYQEAKQQEAAALEGFKDLALGDFFPVEVLSFKLSDLSEIAEGQLFAENTTGVLLWNPSLDWLVWDGCRFAPDNSKARLLAQKFTGKQHRAAQADVQQAAGAAAQDTENTELAARAKKAKALLTFVTRCRSTNGLNHLLTEAAPHLACKLDDLDADPFALNTPAGIVDLRTGVLRPSDPAAFCTKVTAVGPCDDGAELWNSFLDTICCGDAALADHLQTVAGMAALGQVFTETLLLATGDGGNGKSTFFNTLARVLGDYSTSVRPALLMTGNQNSGAELAALRGVRLALAAESEEGQRLDVATVKALCSTDRVAANPKYKEPFSFTPSHTLVLYTNFLPRVGSSDRGTWSRLTVLPFNAHLRDTAGERKDYAEILFTQAGGAVLAWMIEGAQRFIANGYKLTPPTVVREALAEYQKSNDWLGAFMEECCELGENYAASSKELYQRYTAYCQVSGDYRRDSRDFANAMKSAGFELKHKMHGNTYTGLRLHSGFSPQ